MADATYVVGVAEATLGDAPSVVGIHDRKGDCMKTLKTPLIILGLCAGCGLVDAKQQVKPSPDKPARLYLQTYKESDEIHTTDSRTGSNGSYTFRLDLENVAHWTDDVGGGGSSEYCYKISDDTGWWQDQGNHVMSSPPSQWPDISAGTNTIDRTYEAHVNGQEPYIYHYTDDAVWTPQWFNEHCAISAKVGPDIGFPIHVHGSSFDPYSRGKYHRKAQAVWKLDTGGGKGVKRKSLFRLGGTATEILDVLAQPYRDSNSNVVWTGRTTHPSATQPIPATSIRIDGKKLESDGNLWRLYPDNTTRDVTPKVRGKDYHAFTVEAVKHRLVHETRHPALTDTNLARTKLGVGEEVHFNFDAPLVGVTWPDVVWTTTGCGAGTTTNDAEMDFTAPSNAANVTVSVTVKGLSLKEKFTVVEPSGLDSEHTIITSTFTNLYPPGIVAAKMHLNVYVAPTDVSFYRLMCVEVGMDATDVWGCFTNNQPADITHKGGPGLGKGDEWFQIGADNSWQHSGDNGWDTCFIQWNAYPGGFTWPIPAAWRIEYDTNTQRTNLHFSDQVFSIDSSGTVVIQKFGTNVTRTINNVVTPSL